MIANRKQEWDRYGEQTAPAAPAKKRQPRPDARFRSKFLTIALTIAVMAMLITLQSAFIVQTGYDVVQTKGQVAKLEKENELLHLEIAKMKSPQRIQQIATRDLGMVMPQTVYHATAIPQSSGSLVAQSAKGTTSVAGQGAKIVTVSKAEASKER
jgi:cell division protein FtsL